MASALVGRHFPILLRGLGGLERAMVTYSLSANTLPSASLVESAPVTRSTTFLRVAKTGRNSYLGGLSKRAGASRGTAPTRLALLACLRETAADPTSIKVRGINRSAGLLPP